MKCMAFAISLLSCMATVFAPAAVAQWNPPMAGSIGATPPSAEDASILRDGAPPMKGASPEGLSPSDWSSLRLAFEAGLRAVQPVGDGYRARHPGQRWTTSFDGRGFSTQPDVGGWIWGLELVCYGWVGAGYAVARPQAVTTEGQRVAYEWDARLSEWYVNERSGLHHGYTLIARPEGAVGPLTLVLAVRGGLAPVVSGDGRAVRFVDAEGGVVLSYSGLLVLDADGLTFPARFDVVAGSLQLRVEDEGARYPLTIDPVAQQAYVKASNTESDDLFGYAVSVSGDTVVVGALLEDSSATGVNGDESDNGASEAGAAYVYVRNGASWSQQAYLKASNTEAGDFFGAAVSISGDTLVVGAALEDSSASGVNGDGTNNAAIDSGAAYVFVRNGTTWTQQAYFKASNTGAGDDFGSSVAVSGDTIIVGASREDSNATGVNGDGSNNASDASGAAYVFVRSGTTWSQQAYLKASNTDAGDLFGLPVAISGDTVVLGAILEDSGSIGVNGNQGSNNAAEAGAAYVFVRSGTNWSQQAYLKASNTEAGDWFGFAASVSGDTLVVSAIFEDSLATGVNGDGANNGAPNAGAVYLFVRSGETWSQQAYLKASNSEAGDQFGSSVSVSGTTVVVGAPHEDSSATGLDGDQFNNSADGAGAAYAFSHNGTIWGQATYMKPSNTDAFDFFGNVSASGNTLVVTSFREDSFATGVNGSQGDNSSTDAGAAYVFDLEQPEPWSDVGGGTNGSAGPPRLTMAGTLLPGSLARLYLTQAAPSAFTLLLGSYSSTPTRFVGGTLHAWPAVAQVFVFTNAQGELHASAVFSGAPSGSQLWFQAAITDAQVPIYGAALSNGIVGLVP